MLSASRHTLQMKTGTQPEVGVGAGAGLSHFSHSKLFYEALSPSLLPPSPPPYQRRPSGLFPLTLTLEEKEQARLEKQRNIWKSHAHVFVVPGQMCAGSVVRRPART